MRTTPDGRVLCGGEDAETSDALGRPGVMERKIARLQGKVGKLFPDIDTRAAFTWSAAFGETATGLPLIGEIPGHRNCYAALGYGGNGITYSRIAAEILRAALTGERDPTRIFMRSRNEGYLSSALSGGGNAFARRPSIASRMPVR